MKLAPRFTRKSVEEELVHGNIIARHDGTMGDMVKSLQATIERIILDPKYHDLMMLIKSARNGVVYGTKVRFPHALV